MAGSPRGYRPSATPCRVLRSRPEPRIGASGFFSLHLPGDFPGLEVRRRQQHGGAVEQPERDIGNDQPVGEGDRGCQQTGGDDGDAAVRQREPIPQEAGKTPAAIALRGALWAPSGAGCRGAAGSGYYERIIVRGKQPTATGGYTFSGKSGHNDRARPRGYPARLGWGRRISTAVWSTAQLFLAGVAAVGDYL